MSGQLCVHQSASLGTKRERERKEKNNAHLFCPSINVLRNPKAALKFNIATLAINAKTKANRKS